MVEEYESLNEEDNHSAMNPMESQGTFSIYKKYWILL